MTRPKPAAVRNAPSGELYERPGAAGRTTARTRCTRGRDRPRRATASLDRAREELAPAARSHACSIAAGAPRVRLRHRGGGRRRPRPRRRDDLPRSASRRRSRARPAADDERFDSRPSRAALAQLEESSAVSATRDRRDGSAATHRSQPRASRTSPAAVGTALDPAVRNTRAPLRTRRRGDVRLRGRPAWRRWSGLDLMGARRSTTTVAATGSSRSHGRTREPLEELTRVRAGSSRRSAAGLPRRACPAQRRLAGPASGRSARLPARRARGRGRRLEIVSRRPRRRMEAYADQDSPGRVPMRGKAPRMHRHQHGA